MLDLSNPVVSDDNLPPRILIYGPEGEGKNTLALEFPASFSFDLERGTPRGFPVATPEQIPNFEALLGGIQALCEQPHEFKTVIFDGLDRIEAMIFAHLCEEQNWSSIEQPGYGKGYKMALEKWEEFVSAAEYLRETRNVAIIFLAHSEAGRFDDPTTQSYSRYDLRLNNKAAGVVKDKCDAILFLNRLVTIKEQDAGMNKKITKGDGGSVRWVMCEARPAWAAKNRYGLPDKFKFDKGKGYEFLSRFLPAMDTPVTPIEATGDGDEGSDNNEDQ